MDNAPATLLHDDEIERRLKVKAIEEALRHNGPTVSNEQACAEMEREIAEIDAEIADILAE